MQSATARTRPLAHRSDAEVLIVGAGPTGLALATALAGRGIRVLVLDRQHAGANTSRAAVIHAHTLETLEPLGINEQLVARGVHVPRFTIRDRDRTLVSLAFDALPTRYPYALMISQAETEAILRERLRRLGGEIHWQHPLVDLQQDTHGVTAVSDSGTVLRAKYLVGADGMHSTVRNLLGIDFSGDTYGESFVLADARLSDAAPRDEIALYFSPLGMMVVAPLPGPASRSRHHRDSAGRTRLRLCAGLVRYSRATARTRRSR